MPSPFSQSLGFHMCVVERTQTRISCDVDVSRGFVSLEYRTHPWARNSSRLRMNQTKTGTPNNDAALRKSAHEYYDCATPDATTLGLQ